MGLNTKIQLKIIDKDNNNIVEYIPLPLERLIDPNVNTEIPIPLLMIIVPDNVLKEPYVHKNKYVKFEMGNNNIFEIFITKKDFISSNLFDKYKTISFLMIDDSFELYTSGIATGYNS